MREITVKVFTFAELEGKAKERAREKLAQWATEGEWWDCVVDDFCHLAPLLGFDINKDKRSKYPRPCVWFSGFWSQGDGASFDATFTGKGGALKRIREYAAEDKTLHAIARALDKAFADCKRALVREAKASDRKSLRAEINQRGLSGLSTECINNHYSHENTRRITGTIALADDTDFFGHVIWRSEKEARINAAAQEYADAVESARYSLCRWLYRTLKTEHKYLTSDEALQENADDNGYEFTETGEPA